MKSKLLFTLVICLLINASIVIANSAASKAPHYPDMRVFKLNSSEIQSAYVKWGPRFQWVLTRNEINSFITMLQKVSIQDIHPYNGPFPKGGPFQVSLLTKSGEKFTFTYGVGDGQVLYFDGMVFLPEFSNFIKPFIARRASEAR